jgi:hypothetical protein
MERENQEWKGNERSGLCNPILIPASKYVQDEKEEGFTYLIIRTAIDEVVLWCLAD